MAETDKITRVLMLYNQLMSGKKVNKINFCQEHGIQARSFDRDIEDIRLFLSENYVFDELKYSRKENYYQLSGATNKQLSGEEIVLLVTMLLSLKTFRQDELEVLLRNLVGVTELPNKQLVYRIVKEKLNSFGQTKTEYASLKIQWDIERCILERKVVILNYQKADGNYVDRKVKPMEIIYDDGYVYLVAYRCKEEYLYPAFYRLDRIHSFKVTRELFEDKDVAQYRKLNIRNYLKYMQAGELQEIKVRCDLAKKLIVMESFRETEVMEESKTDCIIKIKSFKIGFLRWLLGQGTAVEVLEPLELRNEIRQIAKALQETYKKGEEDG